MFISFFRKPFDLINFIKKDSTGWSIIMLAFCFQLGLIFGFADNTDWSQARLSFYFLLFLIFLKLLQYIFDLTKPKLYVEFFLVFALLFNAGLFSSISRIQKAKNERYLLNKTMKNVNVKSIISNIRHFNKGVVLDLENVLIKGRYFSSLSFHCINKCNDINYSDIGKEITFIGTIILNDYNSYLSKMPHKASMILNFSINFVNKIISIENSNAVSLKRKVLLFFNKFLSKLKSDIRTNVNSINSSQDGKGIVVALITGETDKISLSTKFDMRIGGISHLLAISGLHLSIISFFCIGFVRKILLKFGSFHLHYDIKKISIIITLFVAFFYLMLTNASVSTVRSFGFFLFFTIGVLIDNLTTPLRTWGYVFIVILLAKPESIFSISFQMSFIGTFALISIYSKKSRTENSLLTFLSGFKISRSYVINEVLNLKTYADKIYFNNFLKLNAFLNAIIRHFFHIKSSYFSKAFLLKIFDYSASILFSSFITILPISIVSAYHFNYFSLLGLITNLFAIPLTEFIILPFAFVGMLFNFSFVGKIFYFIASNVATFMSLISKWLGVLFSDTLLFPILNFSSLSFIVIILGSIFVLVMTKRSLFVGMFLILIGLFMNFAKSQPDFVIDTKKSVFGYRFLSLDSSDDIQVKNVGVFYNKTKQSKWLLEGVFGKNIIHYKNNDVVPKGLVCEDVYMKLSESKSSYPVKNNNTNNSLSKQRKHRRSVKKNKVKLSKNYNNSYINNKIENKIEKCVYKDDFNNMGLIFVNHSKTSNEVLNASFRNDAILSSNETATNLMFYLFLNKKTADIVFNKANVCGNFENYVNSKTRGLYIGRVSKNGRVEIDFYPYLKPYKNFYDVDID